MASLLEGSGSPFAAPSLRESESPPFILPTADPALSISYGYVSPPLDINARAFVNTAAFRKIHSVYASCFPHGTQPPEFFAEMFAFNRDPAMQSQWGPARYEIATASYKGEIVGTAMFFVAVAPKGGWRDSGYLAAVGMDYRAVLPEMRGYRIAGKFEKIAFEHATALAQDIHGVSKPPVFVFNEMASPLTMPFRDFAKDVTQADMHAFDRVGIWNKAGLLRVLPSPGVSFYVDPPKPWFSFQVKTDEPRIGARTVEDVVLRYNALCGTHGQDPRVADPNFKIMFGQLEKQTHLPRIADAKNLEVLRAASDQLLDWYRGPLPAAMADHTLGRMIREHFPQEWAAYGKLARAAQ